MKISTWLRQKTAENIDVSQIELPADVSYDNDPDEIIFFEDYKPCGYFCSENHPFSTVERFGSWYYSRGQDKKAGIHSLKMKWHIFTKDKGFAIQTAQSHME
jgi:hypothetical protein